MKLQALNQILTEMPPPPKTTGELKQYGMILNDPSGNTVDYDEISTVKIFANKVDFSKAVSKYFSAYTKNPDDIFLTLDEIYDHEMYDNFVDGCWIWDNF